MLFLIIFGLIAMFAPGWFMACCGIGSSMEEDTCLVWFFRIFGAILVLASLWFMFSKVINHGPGTG